MSAIMRCDNCGGTWDTGGNGHTCAPEDLCVKLESDVEGMAGDMLRFESRLRCIEKFCENVNPVLWKRLVFMLRKEAP